MPHDGCNFYCSFWTIFCPFTPLTTQKFKILKKMKKKQKQTEISSFYTCVPKITMMLVPEIWCVTDRLTDGQTDGWTDRQKKSHMEVGAPTKNIRKISA